MVASLSCKLQPCLSKTRVRLVQLHVLEGAPSSTSGPSCSSVHGDSLQAANWLLAAQVLVLHGICPAMRRAVCLETEEIQVGRKIRPGRRGMIE